MQMPEVSCVCHVAVAALLRQFASPFVMRSCQLTRNSEELWLGMYSHSHTYAIAALGKVRGKSSLAQVGIEHASGQPHTHICVEASPAQWNMTCLLSVLLPSRILLPPSHYTESRRVSKTLFFLFSYFKKNRKSEIALLETA